LINYFVLLRREKAEKFERLLKSGAGRRFQLKHFGEYKDCLFTYFEQHPIFPPANIRSTEQQPPPETTSERHKPITSRWYSYPSPGWLPNQFIKNPFGRW
jgi:hypothetical protein